VRVYLGIWHGVSYDEMVEPRYISKPDEEDIYTCRGQSERCLIDLLRTVYVVV
jgi:hypothetical protein